MIYLAQFTELSGRKYIVLVTFIEDNESYDNTKFLKLSDDAYEYLNSKVSSFANGFHSGYYVDSTLKEIQNTDEIQFDEDSERLILDGVKRSYLENTYEITNSVYANLTTYFKTMILSNNVLLANSIFVNESNKTEIYSKVLNTNDTTIIEAYLKFVEAMEYVNHYNGYFKNFNQYKDSINNSTTVEEVKSIYLELKSNYE